MLKINGTYLAWRTNPRIPEATAADADDAAALNEHVPRSPGAGYKMMKYNPVVLFLRSKEVGGKDKG